MATTTPTSTAPPSSTMDAASCVRALVDEGYSPQEISEMLENRISWRTIYRWRLGEHRPQRPSDLEALRALTARHVH